MWDENWYRKGQRHLSGVVGAEEVEVEVEEVEGGMVELSTRGAYSEIIATTTLAAVVRCLWFVKAWKRVCVRRLQPILVHIKHMYL
jgi:hypothetical protein